MTRRTVVLAGAAALASGCGAATRHAPEPVAARPERPHASAPPPVQFTHGPLTRPQVALTFHGRGEPALTTALLAEAERAGARLTVLAVGDWLDAYPRLAHRILDGGHELGNHTQTHRDIDTMSPADAYAEIAGCADRLRRLTGSPGGWFRPSQARLVTPTVQRAALRAGYARVLSYDVDSLDYTDPGAPAIGANVLHRVRPGSIVSLHLGHPGTIAALPAILDGLHARSLHAVTATELLT